MPSDIPAALKGVSRLAQASTLTVDGVSRVAVRRYWHPAELLESARLSPTDVRDRFLQLMAQAAARTLTGQDATLLSGGIDSPAVAAFAAPDHRQRTGRPIGALSCVFPDLPTVDERLHRAGRAALRYRAPHLSPPGARARRRGAMVSPARQPRADPLRARGRRQSRTGSPARLRERPDGRLCGIRVREPSPPGVSPAFPPSLAGSHYPARDRAPARRRAAAAGATPAGHLRPRPVGQLVRALAAAGRARADPRLARRPP